MTQSTIVLTRKNTIQPVDEQLMIEYAIRFLTGEIEQLRAMVNKTSTKETLMDLIDQYEADLAYLNQQID